MNIYDTKFNIHGVSQHPHVRSTHAEFNVWKGGTFKCKSRTACSSANTRTGLVIVNIPNPSSATISMWDYNLMTLSSGNYTIGTSRIQPYLRQIQHQIRKSINQTVLPLLKQMRRLSDIAKAIEMKAAKHKP